jgi:lysophospholipase L1-like esterase
MRISARFAIACMVVSAASCGRMPATERAHSEVSVAVRPSGLVFVFTGESNSGGAALNAHATESELAPRASVQIMNLTSGDFLFEDLDIGTNNLRDHDGFRGEYHLLHGLELHLANAVEAGEFPGISQVFLVKTGQGGSVIAEWQPGGVYWAKFLQRIAAAKRQIAEPRWVVWLSLGINDAGSGTPVATFKRELAAHVRRIQAELPGAVVVMTAFQSMEWMKPFDAALEEIARELPNVLVVDTSGADKRDGVHWSYAGFKAIGAKMIAATRAAM